MLVAKWRLFTKYVRSLFHTREVIIIALVGLGLRLLLMPLFVDPDLLIMQFSAHFLAYHGSLVGQTLYPDQLAYPLPIYLLMAALQVLFKPLMPHFDTGIGICNGALLDWIGTWGRNYLLPWLSGWFCTSHRYLYLFLLKVHYLPFDFASSFLITRLVSNEQTRLRLFRFWMFNPIILYATYCWGQFDIIPVFFCLLSLYCARRGNPIWAALWLGIGASFKGYPLLFLPFLVLFVQGFWKKIGASLAGILPYVICILPYFFISAIDQSKAFLATGVGAGGSSVLGFGHELRLFDALVGVGNGHVIYVYFVIYGILLLHAYWRCRAEKESLARLWEYEFAVLMLMFPLILFHPYWLVWLVPLVGLYWTSDRLGKYFPYGVWLFLCAILVLWDFGSKIILVLTPTFPQVLNLPDPQALISLLLPAFASKAGMVIDVFRSWLFAMAIGLTWFAFKDLDLRFDNRIQSK